MKAEIGDRFKKIKHHGRKPLFLVASAAFVFAVLSGFFIYKYVVFSDQIKNLEGILAEREVKISNLEQTLTSYEEQINELGFAFNFEKSKNSLFEEQINKIAGTVGELDKLRNLDQELLYKYSKVYFLNEHYVPESLGGINLDYIYNREKPQHVLLQVKPFLESLISESKINGMNLKVISSFRPFGEQASLKYGYTVTYGSGANQFSADQGYSEHQLGTTVDFTTDEIGENLDAFGKTKEFEWLKNNAYKYGFTLSYPENNYYYQFEPWHWRFVGVKLASKLYEENKHFYDLEQREIDDYLIHIFD